MKLASAYLTVIAIWSTTPLAMKWSTETLAFTEAAGVRTVIGALVCSLILLARREPIPVHRAALLSYASAVIGVFGAMLCAFWAVQFIPSGMVSVMFGLAPVFSGVFAWFLLGERGLGLHRLLGVLIALLGLGLVFRSDLGLDARGLPGIVAAVCGTGLFALSAVLVKKTSADLDAIAHTTGSLLMSLPLFALAWWLIDTGPQAAISLRSVAAVVYLGVIASTLGFVVFLFVLRRMTAARVALIPLLTPVIALLLGTGLAGEAVAGTTLVGAAVILFGLCVHEFGHLRWASRRA